MFEVKVDLSKPRLRLEKIQEQIFLSSSPPQNEQKRFCLVLGQKLENYFGGFEDEKNCF